MTFEELLTIQSIADERLAEYEKEIKAIHEWWKFCQEQYIREHLPFPFKERQRATVTLRVTEETIACTYRGGGALSLGKIYSKTGLVTRYFIGGKGELRPDFWAQDGYYPSTDEVVSIELAEQSAERCGTCRHCRDGGCFVTGGVTPVRKTEPDSYICGYYDKRRNES